MKTMQITLYKSSFCPRCLLTARYLLQLQQEHPQLEVRTVDILWHPKEIFAKNIRMIPAIEKKDHRLTLLLPDKDRIRQFLFE